MHRLLSINFKRLFLSRIFWLGIAAAAVFSLWEVRISSSTFYAMYPPIYPSIDDTFFLFSNTCGFFSAVFCSLFIGKRFRDGAVRNEVIIGYTRKAIYLSNLIVCTVAGWLMYVTYILIYLCVGIPLLGSFQTVTGSVLLSVLCTFLLIASFTSIFTMITMLVQNRVAAIVICILFVLLFLPVGERLCAQMKEPEQIIVTWQSINFKYEPVMRPNPQYIGGAMRGVIRVLCDFLPAAQAVNLASPYPLDPGVTAIGSAMVAVVVTWIGTILFRKRNLK